MRCIQCQCSFPSLQSQPKQKQMTQKWLCPSIRRPTRTRAIINPLILADTSQPKGGDVSVLLLTGGLLLFVYGITNFVVPAFISKEYESDDKTEEYDDDEDDFIDDGKDGMPKPKSLGKKRGFQGTRT